MGASKTYQYNPKQTYFAKTAKAVGHPARVAIIQHLARYGHVTNLEIMELTRLSDGTISQHLKELVAADLLTEVFIDKHFYVLTDRAERSVAELQLLFQG